MTIDTVIAIAGFLLTNIAAMAIAVHRVSRVAGYKEREFEDLETRHGALEQKVDEHICAVEELSAKHDTDIRELNALAARLLLLQSADAKDIAHFGKLLDEVRAQVNLKPRDDPHGRRR